MSTKTYTLHFNAPGTQSLPQGRFFMIKSAAAALDIVARKRDGQPVRFEGVGAGLKYSALSGERWYELQVQSASVQVVEVVVSDDAEVDFANVVTVSGSVGVVDQPAGALSTPARIACGTGADQLVAPANASRRRITIQVPSTELNSVVAGPAGELGTSRGLEIQPGMAFTWATTAAIYARGVGGAVNVQVMEET